jgi:hypothetical protein
MHGISVVSQAKTAEKSHRRQLKFPAIARNVGTEIFLGVGKTRSPTHHFPGALHVEFIPFASYLICCVNPISR